MLHGVLPDPFDARHHQLLRSRSATRTRTHLGRPDQYTHPDIALAMEGAALSNLRHCSGQLPGMAAGKSRGAW